MKEMSDLDVVWTRASQGSILPLVLSTKITHTDTQKQGRIQLFDLLLPPFSAPMPNAGRTIYQSFSHLGTKERWTPWKKVLIGALVNLAKASSASYTDHLPYNQFVLTYLLAHPICGHEKFSVFLYLNVSATYRSITWAVEFSISYLGSCDRSKTERHRLSSWLCNHTQNLAHTCSAHSPSLSDTRTQEIIAPNG